MYTFDCEGNKVYIVAPEEVVNAIDAIGIADSEEADFLREQIFLNKTGYLFLPRSGVKVLWLWRSPPVHNCYIVVSYGTEEGGTAEVGEITV